MSSPGSPFIPRSARLDVCVERERRRRTGPRGGSPAGFLTSAVGVGQAGDEVVHPHRAHLRGVRGEDRVVVRASPSREKVGDDVQSRVSSGLPRGLVEPCPRKKSPLGRSNIGGCYDGFTGTGWSDGASEESRSRILPSGFIARKPQRHVRGPWDDDRCLRSHRRYTREDPRHWPSPGSRSYAPIEPFLG